MSKSRLLSPFYLAAFCAGISASCLELKAAHEGEQRQNRRQVAMQEAQVFMEKAQQYQIDFYRITGEFDEFSAQVKQSQQLDLFKTLERLMDFIASGETIAQKYFKLSTDYEKSAAYEYLQHSNAAPKMCHIQGIRETVMWPKSVAARLFPLMQAELGRYAEQYGFGPDFLSRYDPHHQQDGILANLPQHINRGQAISGMRNSRDHAFGIDLARLLKTAYSAARSIDDKANAFSRFSDDFRPLQADAVGQVFLAIEEQDTSCTAGFCGRFIITVGKTLISLNELKALWQRGFVMERVTKEMVELERAHAARTMVLRDEEGESLNEMMQRLEASRREITRRQQESAAASSVTSAVQQAIVAQKQQNVLSTVDNVTSLKGFDLTTKQGIDGFVNSFGDEAPFVRKFLLVCQTIKQTADPDFPIISMVYTMSQDQKTAKQGVKEMLSCFGEIGEILSANFRNELA